MLKAAYFISSIVALFMGSTCNMWHKRFTTVLLRYSGIGNIPAATLIRINYLSSLIQELKKIVIYLTFDFTKESGNMFIIKRQCTAKQSI